jgi:Mn2+/Fe2+ NRAMP family transporter
MVMWCAAITSVTGSAYTSVSFLKTFHPLMAKNEKWVIVAFITISALIFVAVGQPVKVLVAVGALNGFILPLALGLMLMAVHRKDLMKAYKHPLWLTIFGVVVIIALLWISMVTLRKGIW